MFAPLQGATPVAARWFSGGAAGRCASGALWAAATMNDVTATMRMKRRPIVSIYRLARKTCTGSSGRQWLR
jgi:hypothetical protein